VTTGEPRRAGPGAEDGEDGGGRAAAADVPAVLRTLAGWSWRLLVVLAAVAVLGYAFLQLYVVVVPVVLALFLAAALEPLVSALSRRGWPRALAAATVFLGGLAVLVALFAWIGSNVAAEFDEVGDQLNEAVVDAKDWLQGEPFNLTSQRVDELEQSIRDAARGAGAGLSDRAAQGARVAGEVLGALVLLLFTLFFLLKDGARMAGWFASRLPPARRDDVVAVTRRSRDIMRQYLIATGLTGLIDGVLIGVALIVLGVPLVLPLAVLTFLGGFIPIVGATVAGLVAAAVALVDGGVVAALLVVGATVVVQQVEGNLLQPLILERAVRLHPLVTVWAVGAGLIVGGLLGAFLSVPILAIVVAVISHFRHRAGTAGEDISWEESKGRRQRTGKMVEEPVAAATGEEPSE